MGAWGSTALGKCQEPLCDEDVETAEAEGWCGRTGSSPGWAGLLFSAMFCLQHFKFYAFPSWFLSFRFASLSQTRRFARMEKTEKVQMERRSGKMKLRKSQMQPPHTEHPRQRAVSSQPSVWDVPIWTYAEVAPDEGVTHHNTLVNHSIFQCMGEERKTVMKRKGKI